MLGARAPPSRRRRKNCRHTCCRSWMGSGLFGAGSGCGVPASRATKYSSSQTPIAPPPLTDCLRLRPGPVRPEAMPSRCCETFSHAAWAALPNESRLRERSDAFRRGSSRRCASSLLAELARRSTSAKPWRASSVPAPPSFVSSKPRSAERRRAFARLLATGAFARRSSGKIARSIAPVCEGSLRAHPSCPRALPNNANMKSWSPLTCSVTASRTTPSDSLGRSAGRL